MFLVKDPKEETVTTIKKKKLPPTFNLKMWLSSMKFRPQEELGELKV